MLVYISIRTRLRSLNGRNLHVLCSESIPARHFLHRMLSDALLNLFSALSPHQEHP